MTGFAEKKKETDDAALLEVCRVRYSYRTEKEEKTPFSLRDIDFRLDRGYILALLGLNGAGKSTLFEILMGNLAPDSGSVRFMGQEITPENKEFRQKIAFISDKAGFPENVTLEENAELFGGFYEKFQYECWERHMISLGFSEKQLKQYYGALSLGEQRKFQMAFALAHEPALLLMDEPTANLDIGAREAWMEMLQKYVAEKEISVIISTHMTGNLDRIADYILLLDRGNLLLYADREEISDRYGEIELAELILRETEGGAGNE